MRVSKEQEELEIFTHGQKFHALDTAETCYMRSGDRSLCIGGVSRVEEDTAYLLCMLVFLYNYRSFTGT